MSKYIREYIVKVTIVDYDAMFGDALDALRYSEQGAREQLLMEQVEALPQPLEEVVFDDVDESLGEPGGFVFIP